MGIGVYEESTGFEATGNWIGVELNGGNDGNVGAGIFIGPGSNACCDRGRRSQRTAT